MLLHHSRTWVSKVVKQPTQPSNSKTSGIQDTELTNNTKGNYFGNLGTWVSEVVKLLTMKIKLGLQGSKVLGWNSNMQHRTSENQSPSKLQRQRKKEGSGPQDYEVLNQIVMERETNSGTREPEFPK